MPQLPWHWPILTQVCNWHAADSALTAERGHIGPGSEAGSFERATKTAGAAVPAEPAAVASRIASWLDPFACGAVAFGALHQMEPTASVAIASNIAACLQQSLFDGDLQSKVSQHD